MGTFAEGNVNIYFDKKEDAKKVHELLTVKKEGQSYIDPEASFVKYLGEEGGGGYCFYDFMEEVENEVNFNYSSGRVQNAEWQMEQLTKLLKVLVKKGEIEGVGEFSASLMIDSGCGFYMEGDDFNEE